MKNDQRRELEAILNAAASRRRPAYDYAGMSAERFVLVWSYVRIVEIFLGYLVAVGGGRNRGGQLSWEKFDEITKLADPPLTLEKIAQIAEWYFEPGIFGLLVEVLHEQPHIIDELRKRLKGHVIAKELFIAPLTIGVAKDRNQVVKHLGQEKQFVSFSPNEYEDQDLKQIALDAARKTIQEASKIDYVPLPPFPAPLRRDIREIWEKDVPEAWRREYEGVLGYIKAGLELTDEFIKETARQTLRNLFATTERHKAILAGMEDFLRQGKRQGKSNEESWRAEWDFAEAAVDGRRKDINLETVGDIPTPEESLSEREKGSKAYSYVTSRWGERGRLFLDALVASEGNVAEASRAAGISRVTGNNWRGELQIQLSKKNLAQ